MAAFCSEYPVQRISPAFPSFIGQLAVCGVLIMGFHQGHKAQNEPVVSTVPVTYVAVEGLRGTINYHDESLIPPINPTDPPFEIQI